MAKSDDRPTLRDFFYLDIDNVRSLVAQFREGVPEAFEKTRIHRGGGGLKGPLSLDYAYERADTETLSMHHYLYTVLEEKLREAKRITAIDGSYPFDKWNHDELPDGTIVLAHGFIRILDFDNIVETMRSLPRILEVAAGFQRTALKQQLQSGQMQKLEYDAALKDLQQGQLNKKDVDSIASTIKEMYSGAIRVKVFPFRGDRNHYLVGSILGEHLQRQRGGLWLTGGVESASAWYAMGFVNHLTAADPQDFQMPMSPTLEDHLEKLLVSFSPVAQVAATVSLPALSFTPLAIFRLV